jgi:predicted nucleic acid-binding protein
MNGRIVSNTGPLIALAMTDHLDLLLKVFNEVIVPEAVHDEILAGGEFASGTRSYLTASWIVKRSVGTGPDSVARAVLGAGEAEVIELAIDCNADHILIDERKARKIARNVYGLRVIGSARVLVEAKRKGLIANVGNELTRMRDNGYRIHDSIIDAAKKAADEI